MDDYVFCYECEERFNCPNVSSKDGCDLGIRSPEKEEAQMKPTFIVYTEDYTTARRLANTLYRPALDKIEIVTEELWKDGNGIVVTTNSEIWVIHSR